MTPEKAQPAEKEHRIAQAMARFDGTHLNLEFRNWDEAVLLFRISLGLTFIYIPCLSYFVDQHNSQAVTICIFAAAVACTLSFCSAARAVRSIATVCSGAADLALLAAMLIWALGYALTLAIVLLNWHWGKFHFD